MAATASPTSLKLVGSNGQISLGKQYAGRHGLGGENASLGSGFIAPPWSFQTISAGCMNPRLRRICGRPWPGRSLVSPMMLTCKTR